MHYPSKWHFKSWALGRGGQVLLCLTSLKGFMLQQGIFHIIKTRSLFTKCSWVIKAIHTSVKSFRKAKDKISLTEVLIQSPLKAMKGFLLTPAGFKLCRKERQQLRSQGKTHTSCFCTRPRSKRRVESGSETFLLEQCGELWCRCYTQQCVNIYSHC